MNNLDHRILAARHEFIMAETAGERRVKWRAFAALVRRRDIQRLDNAGPEARPEDTTRRVD